MKKLLASLLCVMMVFCMMPGMAWADGTPLKGTVEGISGECTVNNGSSGNTQAIYYSSTLDWSPADPTIGRNNDAWWFGIKVTAPVGYTSTAQYISGSSTDFSDSSIVKSFDANKDGDGIITLWGYATPELLNEYTANSHPWISYQWNFDWNGDNVNDQTIVSFLKVDGCTLNPIPEAYTEACIGNNRYATLSNAIAAATDGQTITLMKDVSADSYTEIHKELTIDLGGHTFTSTDGGFDVYSNLTLKNGTINTLKWGAWVQSGAKLVVEKDVTMNATSTEDNKGGIMVEDNGSELTLRGHVTAKGGTGVSGLGNPEDGGVIINIEPGASVNCTNSEGAGIYYPNTSTLNVKGSVTGATGIYAKCGTTTIFEGAEVTATGNKVAYQYNGNGFYSTGDAIAVDSCNYPGGTPKLVIQGGTITATKGDAVNAYLGNDCTTAADMSITGGTFSSDVKAHISSSVNEYKKDDGKYIVAASSPANSSGKNAWVKGEDGVYTEIYVPVYVPTTPTTPTDNVTNTGSTTAGNATTSADLSNTTSTSNGTTTATVDKTTADKIVDKAVENKSEEVVIDATANTTTAADSTVIAQVGIPTATLEAIAEKTEADVTVKTDVAEVKLDNTAAGAVAEQAAGDTVQLVVEKVAEDAEKVQFELKVVCSEGNVISDFKGGNVAVTVAVPKAMESKEIVCVYIDENGRISKVNGQKNADGTYTFFTGHFSTYALMTAEEADAAIEAQAAEIQNIKIKLQSKQVKLKNGKKAIKLTWTADSDVEFDGVEIYRSTKRYSGFGKAPIYTTTKDVYYNTAIKTGTKYYYKVKAYVEVEGVKYYTDYSTKAWRTVR